jgi:hypothetical protein
VPSCPWLIMLVFAIVSCERPGTQPDESAVRSTPDQSCSEPVYAAVVQVVTPADVRSLGAIGGQFTDAERNQELLDRFGEPLLALRATLPSAAAVVPTQYPETLYEERQCDRLAILGSAASFATFAASHWAGKETPESAERGAEFALLSLRLVLALGEGPECVEKKVAMLRMVELEQQVLTPYAELFLATAAGDEFRAQIGALPTSGFADAPDALAWRAKVDGDILLTRPEALDELLEGRGTHPLRGADARECAKDLVGALTEIRSLWQQGLEEGAPTPPIVAQARQIISRFGQSHPDVLLEDLPQYIDHEADASESVRRLREAYR